MAIMPHDLRRRVLKLHKQRPLLPGHEIGVALYPYGLSSAELDDWLDAVPCPCGEPGCPEKRILVRLPEKEPVDAWARISAAELAKSEEQREAERERWLQRYMGWD
jgi:hypothetical protein